jgi:hypothetical protein
MQMAFKKYAYYNKGNKVALIEQADSTSSGFLAVAHCTNSSYTTKDTCEAAGAQWIPGSSGSTDTVGEYKSPVAAVTDGLEIEYTYAPTYRRTYIGEERNDAHRFIGWGSDGEFLLLFTYGTTSHRDLSSKFSADQWILVEGVGRWSGLHKVKTASSTGILTTYTNCTLPWNALVDEEFNFDNTPEGVGASTQAGAAKVELIKELTTTTGRSDTYIFTIAAVDAANNGFFKIDMTSDTVGLLGTATLKYAYAVNSGKLLSVAAAISDEEDDVVTIYNAYYDEMIVYEGIEVMEDESFELDLTRYQANAVVLYLRARMFEDAGDIEKYEYYMKQFKKQIEKSAGSRKYGSYMVQGFNIMRK